jgi:hypothetical protein
VKTYTLEKTIISSARRAVSASRQDAVIGTAIEP